MCRDHAADQDDRQAERIPRAVPGQVQHQRHGAGGAEFQQRGAVGEARQCRELHRGIGDDPDRTERNEQSSGAEEAADHGIGHITDGATQPCQTQPAQHDAGQHGRQAERDQDRREQRCRQIGRFDVLDQRGRQNSGHGRGRAVGGGDRKGSELPSPITAASTAELMKVAAMP